MLVYRSCSVGSLNRISRIRNLPSLQKKVIKLLDLCETSLSLSEVGPLPLQNALKREDIVKGKLELKTTKSIKNCINFIRRYEICTVWVVSHALPFPTPQSFFRDKKLVTQNSFVIL